MHSDLKLVVGVLGIYVCYLLYGIAQERVSRTPHGEDGERFRYTLFLLFVQCIVNGVAALGVLFVRHGRKWGIKDSTPISSYALVGLGYISAMFFSNAALGHVDYPTQALAKSCKPIPVLLLGLVMLRKQYPLRKYLTVLLITAGIAVFMLTGKQKKPTVSTTSTTEQYSFGVLLLVGSLLADGFTGNYQEKVLKKYAPTSSHLMLWTNVFATVFVFIGMIATNQHIHAIHFCMKHPAVIMDIVLFSITSALGQNFIFYVLAEFGSLVLSVLTTTRKFFTILISVLLFGNQLFHAQWVGVGMVFLGLGTDIYYSKYKSKQVLDLDGKRL